MEDNGLETFEWKDDFVPGEDDDGGGAWGEPWELDEDEDEDAASQAGGVEGGGQLQLAAPCTLHPWELLSAR